MRAKYVLTAEQLAAIGAIAVESAYLESLVDGLIVELSGVRPDVLKLVMVGVTMIGGKLNLLEKLGELRLRSKKRKTEWVDIISEIKNANGERIIAIHGIWERKSRTQNVLAEIYTLGFSPTGDAEATHKSSSKMSTARLIVVADRISKGRDSLWAFYKGVWLSAWKKRLAARSRAKSHG